MNSKIVNVIKKGELIFLMEKETKKSLLLITFGVVLFALLMHFSEVIKILQRGVSLTLPIMVGLILAFVLNVPMKMFERLFAKLKKKCSSEGGKVWWEEIDNLPNLNLSLDMKDMLRVFTEDDLSEFFYHQKDGKWLYNLNAE